MLAKTWSVATIAMTLLSGESCAQGSWTRLKSMPQGANEEPKPYFVVREIRTSRGSAIENDRSPTHPVDLDGSS